MPRNGCSIRRGRGPHRAARGRRRRIARQLVETALTRGLVRTPAQQGRAVPEPAGRHLVVAHLDDEFRPERLPFASALGAPAARTSWGPPGKPGRLDKLFETAGQIRPVASRQGCGEADMIQPPLVVIEPEEKRSDQRAVLAVTEPADNAIGGVLEFVFLHSVATAAEIRQVGALGDDAVDIGTEPLQPLQRRAAIGGARR